MKKTKKMIIALNKKTNQLEEIVEPGVRICDGNDLVIPICGNPTKCKFGYKPHDNVCLFKKWYMCNDLIRYKP